MAHIADIAQRLFNDWCSKAPYETLSDSFSIASLDEAYEAQLAVQALFVKERGEIAGRKIALTSKAMQEMCGIDHPTAGAFFAGDVHVSEARIEQANFRHLGLEFELALELNQVVEPQVEPHTTASVRNLIAGARPAFELIDDKDADYSGLDVLTLIADNAWSGGVVLGPAIEGWQEMDLGDIQARVFQNGVAPEETNTGAADPLGSLAWVLNHFSSRGITLSKGEYVITGSAVRTRFPVSGDSFKYEIAGVSVEVEIL